MTQVTSNREISITRIYNAPPELVFDVFTQPEHVKHWWGPNGFRNTISKMDVRPGGEWEFIMHGPDGTDYKNKNVFKIVDRPNKLVFDHLPSPKFETTVLFKALPGKKTELEFTMLFDTQEMRDKAIETFGAVEGLKQTLGRLEQYLANELKD
jgi:uncharacterized protein YndB with AHSA1/START domain